MWSGDSVTIERQAAIAHSPYQLHLTHSFRYHAYYQRGNALRCLSTIHMPSTLSLGKRNHHRRAPQRHYRRVHRNSTDLYLYIRTRELFYVQISKLTAQGDQQHERRQYIKPVVPVQTEKLRLFRTVCWVSVRENQGITGSTA